MRTLEELLHRIKEQSIEMVDMRFVDLFGAWHHVTVPAARFDQKLLQTGVPFDGSSIPGFKRVEGGDMV
ncbi:MAG: glutamine synthetase, partial [Pseudomonadota bacterium]